MPQKSVDSLTICIAVAFFACVPVPANAAEPSKGITFNRDVRPILSDHCFACHGFDEKTREADLRLDTAAGAVADLGGYQAIVPGNLDSSEVWKRITSNDDDSLMPPTDFHKPLSDAQQKIIRTWIEQGATYEAHWSFIEPTKPSLPSSKNSSFNTDNPIDTFLQRRLADEGLELSPEADSETLIRRLTLDLTGLPPTPEEVERFLNNDSESAYDELISELQSRVTYGEHMARYWLDLARYADTHGLHLDNERSMWPYRDWVVRAFNQNLPFDEFTRWQLAGDLLEDPTTEQLIASGFNRCNVTTSEGGSINDEWIFRYAVDRTATTVEVWMGLTAGCAVCHDHKFDPLSTKEFYSLYAFFHSAADPAMDGNIINTPPILKLIDDEDKDRIKELNDKIGGIDEEIERKIAAISYEDPGTIDPPPKPTEATEIWFDDAFPAGVKIESSGGPPTKLANKDEAPVFSGQLALTRTSENTISQDFFPTGGDFVVPQDGKFFAHCYLDSENPPETIMVQFHTSSWKNRAVWGAQEKISFGKPNTTEKVHLGKIPETGKWVRLEMDANKLGLKGGTKVTGFAFTQFGGTVTWDKFGVQSISDPANDPAWSWDKWTKQELSVLRKDFTAAMRREFQGRTPDKWNAEETERIKRFWMRNIYKGAKELISPLEKTKAPLSAKIQKIEAEAPVTFVMADLPKARKSFVMLRGAYDNPGEQVFRNVPAFLPPLPTKPESRDYNRLDLANWLLAPEHPLTSRVFVNRVWQQIFGNGLVQTSADFGSQGQPPSHPALLDWLAKQFVEDGWDMKRLVRRIVTSRAYKQSSQVTPQLLEKDPENRLLARGPRLRLDAEVLRDQALYVSGLLVPKVGGPGVKPYQPPNIWEPVGFGNSNTRYYKQDKGDALYRRSLYTFLKRTAPPPFMSSFDAPNREQSCSVRGRSNTPMQALQLMNDVQHVEAARAFAQRILFEGGDSPEQRIQWAWRCVTSRFPTADELDIATSSLRQQRSIFKAAPEKAKELIAYGESKPSPELDTVDLAAYTLLANMLLNLDEVVTKN